MKISRFCGWLLKREIKIFISGRMSDDGFRQRRQNTSRPPSMHVDDFVNMENKGDTIMSQPHLNHGVSLIVSLVLLQLNEIDNK